MTNDSDSSLKFENKKGQLRWNMAMDNVLLDTLVEATKKGKKKGKKWDHSVWKSLITALFQKTNEIVYTSHIENRLRQMKSEFANFVELKEKSGATYDSVKQSLTVSDNCWKEILSNDKDRKKFKAFQNRGLKWNFEKLSIITGNSSATGSCSFNGIDEVALVTVEEKKDDLVSMKENTNLEDGEDNVSTERSSKRLKIQHYKRSLPFDEVKDMIEGMSTKLDKLQETVDPLTFGRKLREKLMEVQGFSRKYLNMAFKLLMRDRVEGEIFLLTDDEDRKDILNDFHAEIGDL